VSDPINIVLIGPPGSGKGTQAARICERYHLPWISTGEILRAAVKAQSLLGRRVQAILASGGLVDDGVMIDLIRCRLAEPDAAQGFILDGFPRTMAQAVALDTLLHGRPVQALLLDVPEGELERRLGARRICSTCKTLYATGTRYGSEEELCSKCGGTLIRRDDDNIDVIRNRLRIYHETADPLIDHYKRRGVLSVIDGSAESDKVTRSLVQAIETGHPTRARK
jgi:adenylate kinase